MRRRTNGRNLLHDFDEIGVEFILSTTQNEHIFPRIQKEELLDGGGRKENEKNRFETKTQKQDQKQDSPDPSGEGNESGNNFAAIPCC